MTRAPDGPDGPDDPDGPAELVRGARAELSSEPPVVARLVIEIRSDGSRTIARGGIEDLITGQKVAIEAKGDSPLQLALALAKSIVQLPRLTARSTIRGLLGRKKP